MQKDIQKLELRCASWGEFSKMYQEQFAKEKLIISLEKPLELGASVKVELTLPSKTKIDFIGICKEILKDKKHKDRAVVEISEISLDSMWIVESAMFALKDKSEKQDGNLSDNDPSEFDTSLDILAIKNFEEIELAAEELIQALFKELGSMSKLDPFKVLECSYAPSDEDVKYSFSRLAKRYHPDKFVKYNIDEVNFLSEELFLLIRDAYEALYTESKREEIRQGLDIDFSQIESEIPFDFFDDSASLFDDLGAFDELGSFGDETEDDTKDDLSLIHI